MKKFVSLLLVVSMCLSLCVSVFAEEAYQITPSDLVKVFVNGKAVTQTTAVTATDKIKLTTELEGDVIYSQGKYYDINTVFYLNDDADFTDAVALFSGLSMIEGAQVRVGNLQLENGGKINGDNDSGLRFLATANYTDTIILDANVEFGIKVIAEGSDIPVYVKADKFQNEDHTVFTAAITNLNESNYNRTYTACGYALVPLADNSVKEINTESVSRSIYQVSVGIMKNSSAEAEDNLPYTINEAVKNVLNAYISQTGIRLTYTADGSMAPRVTGNGAYTGDLFFDVESTLNDNGGTDVVITPLNEADGFGNSVEIPVWWQEYLRINNNKSVINDYISNVKLEDGVVSFTFTLPDTTAYTFNQEDNVTIVSEITSEYIKGFKAGEVVTYNLANTVTLLGLATTFTDIVPGSVILTGTNKNGDVAAIELLASLGMPVDPEVFEDSYGVYDAADGSTKYKNIVAKMSGKSAHILTCVVDNQETKVRYTFESIKTMCYRVGIAMSDGTPVISINSSGVYSTPNVFDDTSKYTHYVYLRYNSEKSKVVECVLYCVPKDLDFSGDGEYSDIFSLNDYYVVIE